MLSVRISAITAVLLSGSIVNAQTEDTSECLAIKDDIPRLACYDAALKYVKDDAGVVEVEAETPIATGQHWRLTEENSALDDRTDIWLSVTSKNTEGNSIGSPIRATLFMRCMENKTNVLIGFDRYTTDNQNVRFRLDDTPVQSQWMETMRGGDGIGVWSGGPAIPLIKKFLGHSKLVIGYNTYTGPVEFEFDISGLDQRIEPLANSCGWKP